MNETAEQPTIPEIVIIALEMARSDGRYNMLDRNGVLSIILEAANDNDDDGRLREALDWLVDHESPHDYMAALKAMGAARRREGLVR